MAEMTGAAGTNTINQSRRVRSGRGKLRLKMPKMTNISKRTKHKPKGRMTSRSYNPRDALDVKLFINNLEPRRCV